MEKFKNSKQPTVAVLGCGYVGVTTAAVLSNAGYNVYAIEPMAKRLKILQSGRSFFYEAGVDRLIESAREKGSLIFTDSYELAIPGSPVVFCCVGTPDNADGSSNLSYVFEAANQAAEYMQPGTIFAQKSTVPVGTGAKLKQVFKDQGKSFHYVSNPEFLKEGSAIIDTLWPDRVIAGGDNKQAARRVLKIYKTIERHSKNILKISKLDMPKVLPKTIYIEAGLSSAELTKVSANAFLALKISFANSIAKLADSSGADINEVMDAVGADRRIGRSFLNAGRGYGGGCFPKDVSGLIRSAEDYGVELEVMHAATSVNESMPHYIINKAKTLLGDPKTDNTLNGKKIAILGLAFKPGTSDVRHSAAISIANSLAEQGSIVKAFDPEASTEARERLDAKVTIAASLDEAVKDTDAIFVATDWPEFTKINLSKIAKQSGAKLFVDCMNCLNKPKLPKGVKYVGVGRS